VIYICIPALDEARTVGVLLWKIRRVMEEFPRDYHLLVLDDGSTDETPEVLEPYTRVLPLTVLRNERTQGYAAAVERLFREAVARSTHPKRDVVVLLQGDFTESPADIPALVKRIEGGADVVGTRVAGGEPASPAMRWGRRLLPWLVRRSALPREIRDPLSGFRAYRVAVLKRALATCEGKPLLARGGWAANAELLWAVLPHARRAEDAEVALRYDRRERETRFRPWRTAAELWELRRTSPRSLPEPPAPAPKPARAARGRKPAKTENGDTQHVP
jgi:glycosyltransferase involved in cell wall biosynthesis